MNGTHFSEKEMVKLFKGTCEAIRAMHDHRAPVGTQSRQNAQAASRSNTRRLSGERQSSRLPQPEHHSDDEDDQGFPQAHGDEEGGYSYHNSGAMSLPTKLPSKKGRGAGGEEESGLMGGDPVDLEVHRSSPAPGGSGETELYPFAHRDMKPGNVMIADDGSPILMDFGSAIPARIKVETRSQALLQQVLPLIFVRIVQILSGSSQDIAAEHSTMAYRAPELFDVKTGVTLDEKVDVWVRHPPSQA